MQQSKRRQSDRALRPRMRSPGRPPVARREDRQRFWAAIAKGLTSEDAGVAAGISPAVGTRWFRPSGGMPTVSQAPLSGRYLSFVEREEIALLRVRGQRFLTHRWMDSSLRSVARRSGAQPLVCFTGIVVIGQFRTDSYLSGRVDRRPNSQASLSVGARHRYHRNPPVS